MELDIKQKDKYLILRVQEDLTINSDISILKTVVKEQLQNGQSHIVFAFTKHSYFYTKAIAVLIGCSELIKEKGGTLSIIEANDDIHDILSLIDLDKEIRVFNSEKELLSGVANPPETT